MSLQPDDNEVARGKQPDAGGDNAEQPASGEVVSLLEEAPALVSSEGAAETSSRLADRIQAAMTRLPFGAEIQHLAPHLAVPSPTSSLEAEPTAPLAPEAASDATVPAPSEEAPTDALLAPPAAIIDEPEVQAARDPSPPPSEFALAVSPAPSEEARADARATPPAASADGPKLQASTDLSPAPSEFTPASSPAPSEEAPTDALFSPSAADMDESELQASTDLSPSPSAFTSTGSPAPSEEAQTDARSTPPAERADEPELQASPDLSAPAPAPLATSPADAGEQGAASNVVTPLANALGAAVKLAADANAAAEALETLKRLLDATRPAGGGVATALRPAKPVSAPALPASSEPPPSLALHAVRNRDGRSTLRPAVLAPPRREPAERRRFDVHGFLAGFALSWAFGVVLYLFLTAG